VYISSNNSSSTNKENGPGWKQVTVQENIRLPHKLKYSRCIDEGKCFSFQKTNEVSHDLESDELIYTWINIDIYMSDNEDDNSNVH
jgi:hypothetical protein